MANTESWTSKATLDARSQAMRRPTFYAKHASKASGFTLTELMVSVGIVGILSAIALPNYTNSVHKARQADAANQIAQIQNTIQAYREEYLENPESWSDLARITPVATSAGPASGDWGAQEGEVEKQATTSNGGHYRIVVSGSGDMKTITATPTHSNSQAWDIQACIDTSIGYSDLRKGNGSQGAGKADCGEAS